jgi:hypothetical protein
VGDVVPGRTFSAITERRLRLVALGSPCCPRRSARKSYQVWNRVCLGPEQVTGRVNRLGPPVANRTIKGRFVKGESGNPAGRPKKPPPTALAASRTTP